jgi:thiol:disulfide interchange protein DsbD
VSRFVRRLTALATVALSVTTVTAALAEQRSSPPRVQVDLVSELSAIPPGGTFWIGLRQRIADGWHTYWLNPGDSGEPMQIEWALPAGFSAGPIEWPHPDRIPVGPAMSYGYSREVVFPIAVTVPPDIVPGTRVTLRGQASWLVCAQICIPEEAPAALTLPVASGSPAVDPRGAPMIAAARRAVPTPSPWPASFVATDDTVTVTVAARDLTAERVADVWFYPARWGVIEHAAPQHARIDGSGVTLAIARGQLPDAVQTPIDGVLVVTERLDGGLARHALTIRAEPRPAAPGGDSSALSWLGALTLAFAGGLVLNLMPCVLPVLSVKALGLLHHADDARRHGVAYTAGVLASFAVVGGALLALRAAGAQLGWGFQLQSPVFVIVLSYVFFVMALSLSGFVTLGARWSGAGDRLARRSGYVGSFFTGALATIAATPCTAPFMGVALGFAVTQPSIVALTVFEALALGLALPYLVLAFVPAWRRWLPQPGAWMDLAKQLLAFPLYATVAWLVWVVSRQAGADGVAVALGGLLLIGFAAWLRRVSLDARPRWRRAGAVAVVVLLVSAVAISSLGGSLGAPRSTPAVGPGWETFTPQRLAELRAGGTPVFVDFTAAWCITCLVNERVALRTASVAAAFARHGVVAMKADWTKRDPVITEVLGSFGRNGVPLYVFYPARSTGAAAREPVVLPQILSEGTIIDTIQ